MWKLIEAEDGYWTSEELAEIASNGTRVERIDFMVLE